LVGRNSLTLVSDGDECLVLVRAECDDDRGIRRRVPHRVGQKDRNDLGHANRVGFDVDVPPRPYHLDRPGGLTLRELTYLLTYDRAKLDVANLDRCPRRLN